MKYQGYKIKHGIIKAFYPQVIGKVKSKSYEIIVCDESDRIVIAESYSNENGMKLRIASLLIADLTTI